MTAKTDTAPPENSAAVSGSDQRLVRPCERPVVCRHATYSPERVNKFASSAAAFAAEIEKCNTLSDAKALAEAVRDNWKRFWASC